MNQNALGNIPLQRYKLYRRIYVSKLKLHGAVKRLVSFWAEFKLFRTDNRGLNIYDTYEKHQKKSSKFLTSKTGRNNQKNTF